MKAVIDCIPCIVRQALSAARHATDDVDIHRRVVDDVLRSLAEMPLTKTPAEHSDVAYEVARQVTGVDDPYADARRRSNEEAAKFYPKLAAMAEAASDPIYAAVRIAVAGNVIDLGIGSPVSIEEEVARIAHVPFARDDYDAFRRRLEAARRILYVGDNAGEIFFDKVLLGEIAKLDDKKMTFVVKGAPAINDAVMEDAEAAGIDAFARVITTGCGRIGTPWDDVSDEFREVFAASDLIISKGQGNLETLDDVPGPVFFILKAKCTVVAAQLGVRLGDLVLMETQARAR